MNNVKHYILTRFNVAVSYGETGRKNGVNLQSSCLDNSWLSKRFDIFDKYMFPKMKNQINQDYTWLVLFHADTPEEYKKKIRKYSEVMGNFQPLYLTASESMDNFDQYIQKLIGAAREEWILTSRIDNDDMVSEDYVEKLHRAVELLNKKECFLSFLWGLNWDKRRNMTAYMQYPYNHFISMLAAKEKHTRFVMQYTHTLVGEAGIPVYTIGKVEPHRAQWKNVVSLLDETTREPMWCEIVHETNYMNEMHYWLRGMLWNTKSLDRFNIPGKVGFSYWIHYIAKAVVTRVAPGN